jgi:hypothetical protein
MKKRAGCYGNCGRPAAPGRMFCTNKCGAEWAEEMARGNEDQWCPICQSWGHPQHDGRLQCGHEETGVTEGATSCRSRRS